MKVADLFKHLKRKFDVTSNKSLARRLGVTQVSLQKWKVQRRELTALQIANLIDKASKSAVVHSHQSLVRPIVEFYRIERVLTQQATKYQVIPTGSDVGKHLTGLRQKLEASRGLYIFYDTCGKALYAGQTKKQNLWKELNLAFNRDRSAQVMTLVRHPSNDVAFKPAHEKVRQPKDVNLKLHDLAAYFSAFEVTDSMIDDLEALLVRAFPNDLLNFKMEKFAKGSKKKSTGKAPSKKAT